MSYNSDLQKNNAALGEILNSINELPNANSALGEAVLYVAQELTDEQKAQARENIGAIDEGTLIEELAKRGQLKPEFANDISECTDTSKLYVLPDGHIWAYIKKEVPEVTIPNFTNQIEVVGYESGVRLDSYGANTSGTGYGTTGYIPIGYGSNRTAVGEQVIYLANMEALHTDGNTRIAFYDSNKAFIGLKKVTDMVTSSPNANAMYALGEDGYINMIDVSAVTGYLYTQDAKETAFFRFCTKGIDSESIVTVNEPIEYITSGGESVNGWTDTGLTIVPISAELEERVAREEIKSDYFLREIASVKEQLAGNSKEKEEVVVSDGVPEYIIAESERVAKAVQTTRTAKSLVFPVLSDIHLFDGNSSHANSLISAQYAGMGIKELKKRMHLDFTSYLGDFTWGADNHTVDQVMNDITAFKETTDATGLEIWCVGNHDLNYGKNRDRLLTNDEIYNYIGANADGVKPYANIERGYGYLDFENQKIRVIYLNTCDASDWTVTAGAAARSEWVSPTQIQWLADTALNFTGKSVPNEWGIVVVGHHPLHYGFSCFDTVMQLLEAYKNGLSGSLSCTIKTETVNGTTTYPQQRVNYDFTNTERAEIICNIHGHNHNCGYSQISSSTRTGSTAVAPWLWRFCIPNICANRYNTGAELGNLYGEYDESGNPVYHTKETGTAKATSFCVINIDRKNRKIYAHIFGAGTDREISY